MSDGWATFEFEAGNVDDEVRAILEAIGIDPVTAGELELAHGLAIADSVRRGRDQIEGGPP